MSIVPIKWLTIVQNSLKEILREADVLNTIKKLDNRNQEKIQKLYQ